MKKYIITIAVILLFFVGLSVLLYPVVSDYMNSLSQSRVIAEFNDALVKLSETDYSGIINAAREYNERLMHKANRFSFTEEELEEYYSILDFTGKRVIGTLEINSIKVKLPIYLGTEEEVLQVGLGHFEGTSLPVGGAGTHSVISGHRGLPSSTLLTNVDQLDIGDIFMLTILNETLTYEIDHKVIVEPDNLSYLTIDPDKDYCTLSTCTPYGINSHRLLLRGSRIFPENSDQAPGKPSIRADARRVGVITEYIIAAVPIILLSMIYMFARYIKNKIQKKRNDKE